jgi:hypothetical protein
MKLVTLVLVALSATIAVAQSNENGKPEVFYSPGLNLQIGCPIAFTDVVLKRDARYMPVKQDTAPDNSLAFKYKNSSGKVIDSISIRVELRVKRSIYDLDTTTITRYMTLTGTSGEVLPLNLLTYALGSVTLEQVTYLGGEVWTPDANKNCRYIGPTSAEEIGTLK